MTLFENNAPIYLNLKPYQVLAGHYFSPRFSLSKRFAKIHDNQRVKLITFLRDPLEYRISLYSYGQKKGHIYAKGYSLEEFLFKESNDFARFLECNSENYKERLDYFFFVGIMEKYTESTQILSQRLNMKLERSIPHLNKSNSSKYFDMISGEIKQKFKNNNKLDYLIYSYSLDLLTK